MKQDRLNIHYETLYILIKNRYTGIAPQYIKNELIDTEYEFWIDTPKNNSSKTLEERIGDYIKSEVGRALNLLTKNAKTLDELEDYDDTFYFDENEDIDDKQREDYKYFPHSLIIGEPKKLTNNTLSKKNATYRLNKNIKFSITDTEELKICAKFLYMLFTVEKEHDINDSMVSYLTKRNINDKEFKTLIDTFVQISLHDIYIKKKSYTLDILLALVEIGAEININIKNEKSTFILNNIIVTELIFSKKQFDIVCDGIRFSINNMDDITLIESACNKTIKENILETQKLLPNYSEEIKKLFSALIEDFETIHQVFFQEYSRK
jgi:hypothetical protein